MRDPEGWVEDLAGAADRVRSRFRGRKFELESITNIKSGACPEDCSFCSQSAHYQTDVQKFSLIDEEEALQRARLAEEAGASQFCLVAAWRGPSEQDFQGVLKIVRRLVRDTGLDIHCSLGFLTDEEARTLKQEGVQRYNHNLETAESFFPKICSTHTWQERVETMRRVKKAGMELCSGGIIGLGETPEERAELALAAWREGVDEFPLNILNPRPGTPLAESARLKPLEIVRTIAIFRLIMPKVVLKVSGGREVNLGPYQEFAFRAGADSLILGDYLTTKGARPEEDVELVKRLGFEVQLPKRGILSVHR